MEWISVKDRLPEERGWYLVSTIWENVRVRCAHYKRDAEILWANYKNDDITHWMPLPDPPEDEDA